MHTKRTSILAVSLGLLLGLGAAVLLLRGAQVQARGAAAGGNFLDPGFDGDGRVIVPVPDINEIGREVAIQPDGKLIIVGYDHWRSSDDDDAILARVNPDGSLDETFGNGGVVTATLSSGDDAAYAVAVQPDGKIVTAGTISSTAAIVRYNTDGSLDDSFGVGGVVTTGISSINSWFLGVAVLDDGRIVAGGSTGSIGTTPAAFLLARYQSDGAPDTTLGGTGVVTTSIPGSKAYGWDIAIQPDGKVLLAGYCLVSSSGETNLALARYNTDGSPDGAFGAGGVVTQSLSVSPNYAYGVNVQSDGHIVIGGQAGMAGLLARYNTDGSYDNSFGSIAGRNYVTTTTPGYASTSFIETALRADDGIVAATRFSGSPYAVGITVFDKDGLPKTAFGPGGVITTTNAGHAANDYALLVQPDGKVVMAGHVDMDDTGAYAYDLALWRYDLANNRIYLPIVVK